MKGVFSHYALPVNHVETKGIAKLSTFEFRRKNDPIAYMRAAMDGMAILDGEYVRLTVNGTLMMTDTQMEKRSNWDFVKNANGKVLIAGLGVGLIIYNILEKEDVTEIVIIEKYQDVIDLVSPYFKDNRIKYVCADILEYVPDKKEKYDTIYFDIWPDICTDNLEQMKKLHKTFKYSLNRQNDKCWMNSWMREYLQKQKRKESRYSFY